MYKLVSALFLCLFVTALSAQQEDFRIRPWDAAFRAEHTNQSARLKSDSISYFVPVGSLSGILKDRTGRKIDFEELISRQQGKIVVVDLWTTSCPPCLKSMPAMSELVDALKNEEVSFVFLELSKDQDRWRQYGTSGLLSEVRHNYWLSNKNNARLIKTLALNAVPRYLLFDRQGRLCNAFAPKPEKGLQGYIESLLLDDQFEPATNEKAGN